MAEQKIRDLESDNSIEIEYTVHKDDVEKCKIEMVRPPDGGGAIGESGAATMADRLIEQLDKIYSKEQVHAIARWMLYLSTQQ